jgi:hypothetical protein
MGLIWVSRYADHTPAPGQQSPFKEPVDKDVQRARAAFKALMEEPVQLICETQIHLKWYFTRRKLTHLWFKANRATTLSMLKYDSFGWLNRPSEGEFQKMRKAKQSWEMELDAFDPKKETAEGSEGAIVADSVAMASTKGRSGVGHRTYLPPDTPTTGRSTGGQVSDDEEELGGFGNH